jgi:DNA-directed RNA polymerase subunit RPC12/RpoP
MSDFARYAADRDRAVRYSEPPKGAKCKECGSTKNLVPINTLPEYVCGDCWDEHGYEYDPTPP